MREKLKRIVYWSRSVKVEKTLLPLERSYLCPPRPPKIEYDSRVASEMSVPPYLDALPSSYADAREQTINNVSSLVGGVARVPGFEVKQESSVLALRLVLVLLKPFADFSCVSPLLWLGYPFRGRTLEKQHELEGGLALINDLFRSFENLGGIFDLEF